MIGRIITATGWTFEYVEDEVDLRMAGQLYQYWNEIPPLHESVHSIVIGLGGESKKPSRPRPVEVPSGPVRDERVTKVMAAASELMGAGFFGVQGKKPDWVK